MAAAAAVVAGPALPAPAFVGNAHMQKLFPQGRFRYANKDGTHPPAPLADKLVTGIDVSPGRHRNVFHSRAAPGSPAGAALAPFPVNYEVKEGKGLLQAQLGQLPVLAAQAGQILFL